MNATKRGGGTDVAADKRYWNIVILDHYEGYALARVTCPEYVEYIQLARQDGQWLIVNVLWTDNRLNNDLGSSNSAIVLCTSQLHQNPPRTVYIKYTGISLGRGWPFNKSICKACPPAGFGRGIFINLH